jgi:hypothetical protein
MASLTFPRAWGTKAIGAKATHRVKAIHGPAFLKGPRGWKTSSQGQMARQLMDGIRAMGVELLFSKRWGFCSAVQPPLRRFCPHMVWGGPDAPRRSRFL